MVQYDYLRYGRDILNGILLISNSWLSLNRTRPTIKWQFFIQNLLGGIYSATQF